MKGLAGIVLSLVVAVGLLLVPLVSMAVPSNGNSKAGGLGNHYGWDKDDHHGNGKPSPVPEPAPLTLLGLGIAGVGSYLVTKRRRK